MADHREGVTGAPLVSVVVIGYNQQKFIETTLRSVLQQTYGNLEVIFVNDGSVDDTLAIARGVADSDRRLRIVDQANQGPSIARLNGGRLASHEAEFIAFLDGDDVQHPDYVALSVSYLQATPEATAVIPNSWNIDETGETLKRRGWRRWAPSAIGLPRLIPTTEPFTPFVTFYCASGTVPFFMARHSAYRQLPGWDARLWPFEDTDMLCQLAITGQVHALPEKLVAYRIHAAQGTRSGTQRSRHWNPHSVDVMRRKWNLGEGLSIAQRRTVARACLYLRHVHEPLMILAVAQRALREFIADPTARRLRWLAHLLGEASWKFLEYKVLFWRSTPKWNRPLPEEAFKGLGEGVALPRTALRPA